AKTLFHLSGYTNTSMDDIVKRCGVTKGNLYYYFSSKEELGNAVVEDLVTEWLLTGINFNQKTDPIRQILAMFHRTEKGLEHMECKGGCLFGNLALEVSDLHDGLRRKLADGFLRWEAQMQRLIELGRERGVLKPTLDPKMAACFVIATFEGGILLSKVKKDVGAFKSCCVMIKHFLEGFRV
ncbi:MAG: TetR/AcrR family transcriptional regulator, partial [Nitrospira sp.]|nr:TetR/AcrR family transcriptional regulator [Nitrospira sp.]